jgi:hypothetical protein
MSAHIFLPRLFSYFSTTQKTPHRKLTLAGRTMFQATRPKHCVNHDVILGVFDLVYSSWFDGHDKRLPGKVGKPTVPRKVGLTPSHDTVYRMSSDYILRTRWYLYLIGHCGSRFLKRLLLLPRKSTFSDKGI